MRKWAAFFAFSIFSAATVNSALADGILDISRAYREYNTKRKASGAEPVYVANEASPQLILPKCTYCSPFYDLAEAVNNSLSKLPEEDVNEEVKKRVLINDWLMSTISAYENVAECENPTTHGLDIFSRIPDESMHFAFATDLDLSKVSSVVMQSSGSNITFYNVSVDGKHYVMRVDRMMGKTAVARFYNVRLQSPRLPNLDSHLVADGRKENPKKNLNNEEENSLGLAGPSIRWRTNGLPEKVSVFRFNNEGDAGSFHWTHRTELSNSGLRSDAVFRDENGNEVFTFITKGTAESSELQIPTRISMFEGALDSKGRLRVSPRSVTAEMLRNNGPDERRSDSYGFTANNQNQSRSVFYTWAMEADARLTLHLKREGGALPGLDPALAPIGNSLSVNYVREWK